MLAEPNCYKRGCRHYLGHTRLEDTDETLVQRCEAYPLGIPEVIAYGDDLHLQVKEGQFGGYVFEPPS